jgi:hypothetical protein
MLSNTAGADAPGNHANYSPSLGNGNRSAEQLLEQLPASWHRALLPVGRNKRPFNPATKSGKDWVNWPAFTAEALEAAPAVGLRLGPISDGTIALDFDGPEAQTTFDRIFNGQALPPSISWTSGKPGRRQVAFKVPPDRWAELENRKAKIGALEFRWTGHQSVILGAHPETGSYRWVDGCAPWDVALAEAPAWLLDLMPRKAAPPQTAPLLQALEASTAGDPVPFRDFINKKSAGLIDTGSAPGCCNDDGLELSLELVAVDDWLAQQGVRADETARDAYACYISHCPDTINGESFDTAAAWARFDGAANQQPTPSTPEATLLKRLEYHRQESVKTVNTPRPTAPNNVVGIGSRQAKSRDNVNPFEPANKGGPANFQDLIQGLPDGWRRTKDGVAPSRISVGQMAQLIEGKKGELLRFNEMTMYVEAKTSNGWQQVNDAEMDSGYVLLDQKGWIIGLESVIKALCHVARQRSIHPVREYLLTIERDQSIKPYDLDRVGPDMFRAVLPLHAAMLRKWLVGAVGRALEPGCQMDYALVLHSPKQGIRKTSSFNELASPDWFNSSVPDGDKDFLLNIHSCWIFELAELESFTSQRATGRIKNLITTRADRFRVPYGKTPELRKRSGVFCGTVNTDSFLRDDTGDRRFWVVPIEGDEKLDVQGIRKHRDSIWKAAVLAHRAGELPMLTDEQEGESEQQNERFKVQDAWLEMLQLWMAGAPLARVNDDDPTPRSYRADGMYSSAEIIYSAGLKRPDQIGRGDETRVGPLLKSLGFTASRVVVGSSRLRRWVMDQPRTNRTNLDQPKCVEVGPWESVAAEGVSGDGPTGPTKNSKLGKKDNRQKAGEQAGGKRRESFKEEVGPDGPPAETTSVCNGSDWTNPPSAEVGPGRSKVGPGPVFDQNRPVWLPDLLAIREANPGQLPSIYANELMAKHQLPTDGRTVKALLKAHDAQVEVAK